MHLTDIELNRGTFSASAVRRRVNNNRVSRCQMSDVMGLGTVEWAVICEGWRGLLAVTRLGTMSLVDDQYDSLASLFPLNVWS